MFATRVKLSVLVPGWSTFGEPSLGPGLLMLPPSQPWL